MGKTLLTKNDWALREEVLESYCQVVAGKMAGRAELKELASLSSSAEKPQDRGYALSGRVAVVPVVGTLAKQTYLFHCGATYGGVREGIKEALADPSVKAILLKIDSPGGTVDGCKETADFIYSVRGRKPIHAYADGEICSAAYWLASQCEEIAGPETAQVGSIGVLTLHADWSKADEEYGIKRTFLTAGRYKAIVNDAEPLSQEGRDYVQERLDGIYRIFLEAVAQGRGVDREKAQAMADGKVFLARPALEVGLIDKVLNFEDYLTQVQEGVRMDRDKLKAEHPELYAQLRAEAREGMVEAAAVDKAAGDERGRIMGIHEAVFGGEASAKFKAVVESGVTAEQASALLAISPENQAESGDRAEGGDRVTRAQILEGLHNAAPEPVQTNAGQDSGKADFTAKVKAYKLEHKCSQEEALKAVAKDDPKGHATYLDAAKADRQGRN